MEVKLSYEPVGQSVGWSVIIPSFISHAAIGALVFFLHN